MAISTDPKPFIPAAGKCSSRVTCRQLKPVWVGWRSDWLARNSSVAVLHMQVVAAVDVAFLDACFYDGSELPGRDMSQVPHPLIADTIKRLEGLTAQTEVVLVHLNHTNPVWRQDSQQRHACTDAGFHVGEQGGVFSL